MKKNRKKILIAVVLGIFLLCLSLVHSNQVLPESQRGWPISFYTPAYNSKPCFDICVSKVVVVHNSMRIDFESLIVDLVLFILVILLFIYLSNYFSKTKR
jgi:uncharacterized integral membrane protein